jgi:hypothetical protein
VTAPYQRSARLGPQSRTDDMGKYLDILQRGERDITVYRKPAIGPLGDSFEDLDPGSSRVSP